jgi:hypothetical protein
LIVNRDVGIDNTYTDRSSVVDTLDSDAVGTHLCAERFEHRRSSNDTAVADFASAASVDDGHLSTAVPVHDTVLGATKASKSLRLAVCSDGADVSGDVAAD